MAKKLTEAQIAAIAILSQPNRGGLTYEEVAKEVGVSRQTLHEWRQKDEFHDALKREIVRSTTARLPEVFDSMVDNIIDTGNAAAFRTLVQLHGLLTDKVEVDTKGTGVDMDAIRSQIEALRKQQT